MIAQDYQLIFYQSIKLDIECQDLYFSEYDNGTIMSFLVSKNYIYAFEINSNIGVTLQYTINLTDTLNSTKLEIIGGLTFNNILLILTQNQQVIQILVFTTYYVVLDSVPSNYTFIVGQQYEEYLIFAVNSIDSYVDIYIQVQDQLQLFQTVPLSFIPNNAFDLYITPVKDGIFISYNWSQIIFYHKSSFIQNNIGKQQFYLQIDTTNVTLLGLYQSDFYLYHIVKYNDDNYINIYQGKQMLNSLYLQIKLIATDPSGITLSATTDYINQCDYLSFQTDHAYIYQIPHSQIYQQLPNSQYNIQFDINNIFVVSNLNNSLSFSLNFSILQQNIQIQQVQSLTQISNNLTNGSISINPYQYFQGVIQTYNVSCSLCQNITHSVIITNNYIFYEDSVIFSASYIQDDLQYLYSLNFPALSLLTYNISNYLDQVNLTSSITNLVINPVVSTPILLFLETQTNSITWLINIKSTLYIFTFLNGTQNKSNITVPEFNSSNEAQYAVYNDGILQILSIYSYYCYYYYIDNYTMNLVSIFDNASVDVLQNQEAVGFVNVYNSENNQIFGIYYLNIYNFLRIILLDVSLYQNGSFQVNGYQQFYLEETVLFQKYFQFQYVQQLGQPYILNNTSFVHLAYTTVIDSGILQLEFDGIKLTQFSQVCNIFMINSTFSNNYTNLLTLYDNQIAIMSYAQNNQNSNLTLQIYLIDLNQCQNVEPYSFVILGTFNGSDENYDSCLTYLNSNQLLLSLNDYTYVIEVNQLLEIIYQTNVNTTIILTAQNPFNQLNDSILITFPYQIAPNNSNNTDINIRKSDHIQWYWVLLIIILCLLVLGAIFLLFYCRNNNQSAEYLKFSDKNEIEIESQ